MTLDDAQVRAQSVEAVLRGVAKKTSGIVAAAAVGAAVFAVYSGTGPGWWTIPTSIIFGGALGFLNFRWLAIAVQRLYLRQGATPMTSNLAALIIGILKLTLIFIILFIVIKWQIFHIFGLVSGLSFCFLAIIWEGLTIMNHTLSSKEP